MGVGTEEMKRRMKLWRRLRRRVDHRGRGREVRDRALEGDLLMKLSYQAAYIYLLSLSVLLDLSLVLS